MNMDRFLTFNDVVIIPGKASIEPSMVDLTGKISRSIEIKIPIASSPMDTVTGWRLSLTMARLGGIGVIHRNMSREDQANEVKKVKSQSPDIWNEIPKINITESLGDALSRKEDFFAIVREKDIKGIILKIGSNYLLESKKIDYLEKLLSMVGIKPSVDKNNRPAVAAAISPYDLERAKMLDKAGADVLVTDVAHIHNENALSALKKISKEVSAEIVAG
ncbi:MAG: IMP dehydrogenase, partial [Caldisphaeraceae archaeon]|nr:IMP dehydrogenase [Caldisphaeraceae archaeon]